MTSHAVLRKELDDLHREIERAEYRLKIENKRNDKEGIAYLTGRLHGLSLNVGRLLRIKESLTNN